MLDGFVINVTDFIWRVDLSRQNQIKGSVSCSELDFINVQTCTFALLDWQEFSCKSYCSLRIPSILAHYCICVVKWVIDSHCRCLLSCLQPNMLVSEWHDHTACCFGCAVVALWSIEWCNPVHSKAVSERVFGTFAAASGAAFINQSKDGSEMIWGHLQLLFSWRDQEKSIGSGPVSFGMNVAWAYSEGERIYLSNRV